MGLLLLQRHRGYQRKPQSSQRELTLLRQPLSLPELVSRTSRSPPSPPIVAEMLRAVKAKQNFPTFFYLPSINTVGICRTEQSSLLLEFDVLDPVYIL